jgi:hypothetical protein
MLRRNAQKSRLLEHFCPIGSGNPSLRAARLRRFSKRNKSERQEDIA